MGQGTQPDEVIDDIRHGRLNRRAVLGRAAALGVGAAAVGPWVHRGARVRAQEKATIRLGTWAGQEEAAELQRVIDQVNQAATTFEIVSEPQPADYYTRLQTTVAGNTAADLFWISQEYVAGYADSGALLDITDLLAADESPAANVEDYFPAIFKTGQYQDRTYALPWISQPVMLYYNPALFDAAELAYPDETWDWNTFEDAAAKITDPSQERFGTAFYDWPPIQMFIWQAGGEVITEDLASCPIDTPEAIAGAQFYQELVYNETYGPSEAALAERGAGDRMKAGQIAMFFGGAADDFDYAQTKDPNAALIKVALVPKGPANRTTFAWTGLTAISAGTENPDAAYQALVALTDGIHHWKVVAPRQSLANEDTIVAAVPGKAESAPVIVQALPEMRSFHVIPQHQEWDTVYGDVFKQPLYHHEGTPEELAEEARPELEDLLPN